MIGICILLVVTVDVELRLPLFAADVEQDTSIGSGFDQRSCCVNSHYSTAHIGRIARLTRIYLLVICKTLPACIRDYEIDLMVFLYRLMK